MSTCVKFQNVKHVIAKLFPEYKGRRDVYLMEVESVKLSGTYWDSGSRSSYAAFEPISEKVIALPRFDPPQFGGPVNPPPVPLSDGQGHYIVVAERHMGAFEYITLYVHPDNALKFLPAPVELSLAQRVVLIHTRSLKSSYAGISDYRFYEAHERTGITRQAWDAARADLIALGYLNKAGAITADGKNAVGDASVYSLDRDCLKS
jgi:hypothetical protein